MQKINLERIYVKGGKMTSKMSKKLWLFVHENSKKIVPAFTFCGKVCFLYELVFWTFIKVFQNGEIMSRKFIISIFSIHIVHFAFCHQEDHKC